MPGVCVAGERWKAHLSIGLLCLILLPGGWAEVQAESSAERPEWVGREKTLRSDLRAGEVIQFIEYKTFFTRHLIVECFDQFDGFAITLGWAEISIDRSRPVHYSVDGRELGSLPALGYSHDHFMNMPTNAQRSIEVVASFIRGLEASFRTVDWKDVEFEHDYSLHGFTRALESACGWHPAFTAAKSAANSGKLAK